MTVRRAARCLAAVAALALAVSSCTGSKSTTAPLPKPSPPNVMPTTSYYAPGVPYVLDGKLYIDHRAQPGNWLDAQTVGAYTAASRTDPKTGEFSFVLMRNGTTIQVEHGLFVPSPEFSPDGTKVAWFETDRGNVVTLVRQDLSHSHGAGRFSIPITLPFDGASVGLDIENDGTVYYDLQDTSWSWTPGKDPVRAQPHNHLGVNPAGFRGVKVSVSLSPDHLWGVWKDNATDRLIVQKPGDLKSRFSIQLPAGSSGPSFVAWQSPTVVTIHLAGYTKDGLPKQAECDIVFQVCDAPN